MRIKRLGFESRTCFLPMVTPQSEFMMRLYAHYKNRLLPDAGGLLDQKNVYLEAMETIGGFDNGDS